MGNAQNPFREYVPASDWYGSVHECGTKALDGTNSHGEVIKMRIESLANVFARSVAEIEKLINIVYTKFLLKCILKNLCEYEVRVHASYTE